MSIHAQIPDWGGPSAPPPQDCAPVNVAAAAERIHGEYGRGNATRQLLEELGECCDPRQAQALLDELQKRFPDDWASIASTNNLSALRGGDYSRAGLTNLIEALALKQAQGTLTEDDLFVIFGAGVAGTEPAQNAGAQMLFLASGSQQVQQFEASLARKAMEFLAAADRNSASHGNDVLTTGWANNVISGLGGDYNSRQAIMEAYAAMSAGQRQHIRELLGDKESVGYGSGPDALASLIQAIAEDVGPNGETMAVEMANWAGDNQEFFNTHDFWGSHVSDPRADALGMLFTTNSRAILDDLTDGYSNPDQYASDDGKRLGFLLSLTAFNPDNLFQASVNSQLNTYKNGLVEAIRLDPAGSAAQGPLGRLEILSPALMIASAAPYLGNLESNEARAKGIVSFVNHATTLGSLVPTGRFAEFLLTVYGTAEGLTDSQISSAMEDFLMQAMSGTVEERELALREIAGMVTAGVQTEYADIPVIAGAMSRRVEDTVYDMLVAISNNDVAGFMKTYSTGN